jgi:DEAD/DEAH box helicase domain-containing protein
MEELRGLAAEVRKAVSDKGGKVIYEYNEFYGDPEPGPPVSEAGLPEPLINMLRSRGIERLYRFQWEAVSLVNKGEDVVVISGTGTGKTEAFMIPVLERALRSRGEVVALLVYPTKALARDQARRLSSMMSGVGVPFAILDGDTPRDERRRIYENPPPILITNPDMLHVGLALSKDYRELVSTVGLVVLDELHVYQGVFGSHAKWILYRLQREAKGEVQFVGSAATIGNPEQLASELFSKEVAVVRGPRRRRGAATHLFVDYGNNSRWSFASYLISALTKLDLKVLAFTDSQQMAELVARIAKRSFSVEVGVHRAGLPAEQRKEVERAFAQGRLRAVVATSTLELGIDIGDLDAVVMASLPKSFSSYLQRAGRAGRRGRPGIIVTLLGDDPIEAYYASRPAEFFNRPPDPGYIEPSNREVAKLHLVALSLQRGALRASELPAALLQVLNEVEELGLVRARGDVVLATPRVAQDYVEARGIRSTGPIVKLHHGGRVIGEREMPMALYDLHPGAVYYHGGKVYLSTSLDLGRMRAELSPLPESVSFYTKPLYDIDVIDFSPQDSRLAGPVRLAYGDVHVMVSVRGYVVKDESSGQVLSEVYYEEPIKWDYLTKGVMLKYPLLDFGGVEQSLSAYHALEHVLISASRPIVGASDTDLSGVSYPTGHIVIYDSHVGGNGASRLVFERLEEIEGMAEAIVGSCTCEDGCPRCVFSPYCGNNNKYLSRKGALKVLRALRGLGPVKPEGLPSGGMRAA